MGNIGMKAAIKERERERRKARRNIQKRTEKLRKRETIITI